MNDLNTFPISSPITKPVTALSSQEVACDHCGMFRLCGEAGFPHNLPLFNQVVSRRAELVRNGELLHAGQPFRHLFAVKSGALAEVGVDSEGNRKVFGFYFPGDMLGFDAIDSGQHCHTVVALEKSAVCKLDYANVALLGEQQSGFYHQLISAMSSRLKFEHWTSLLLGTHSTEQRLAAFMLYLSLHLKARGLAHEEFRLPMTRRDIADYLGMAMETVSRALGTLQKKGILVLKGRSTRISDMEALIADADLVRPSVSV